MIVTLAIIAVSVYVYIKAERLFAVRYYEQAYTLKNKCGAVLYADNVKKQYHADIYNRASKLK